MTVFLMIALLLASNVFMTVAWYGHLRFMNRPLWLMVLVSWSVAFFEYCLQVPANRLGYRVLTSYQLKTIQEVIGLAVFILFAEFYLAEEFKPKHLLGFILLVLAVWSIFQDQFGQDW